ncbi:MAG: hypothetical protein K2J74_01645, partial [Muribaculaceae bacterium]|nr:hypothetical protein [Muribaculaceae bacterium]
MKKLAITLSVALLCVIMNSCGGKSTSQEENDGVLSVDYVLAQADNLVGDTIIIEGVCSHLCSHGGRKAFVAGSADSIIIRCEAYPLMGMPFPQGVVRHPIQILGILREQRIDENALLEMEKAYQEVQAQTTDNDEEKESGCATERLAQGQRNTVTFADRMADYRAKIAARQAKEGKPYLSYYYL